MLRRVWIYVVAGAMLTVSSARVWAQADARVAHGMEVYAEQKCSICHAIGGKGNAKGALDDVGARLKADEIREWITNPVEMTKKTKAERRPVMRAYPDLVKDDLDAVVAYLLTLNKK